MNRTLVVYLELSCAIVAFGSAFGQMFLVSRVKRDIIRDRRVRPDLAIDLFNDWKVIRRSNLFRDWKLLRLHKSVFPTS